MTEIEHINATFACLVCTRVESEYTWEQFLAHYYGSDSEEFRKVMEPHLDTICTCGKKVREHTYREYLKCQQKN